jgi:protein phosphatase
VTQAIGASKNIKPEISSLVLQKKDRVLLCSDGLWEALADEDLCSIVGTGGSMQELAVALVDSANAAGGTDNITAILYEHGGSGGGQAV